MSSLGRRGGRDINENREATFERSGRGGAKRKPDRAQPQEKIGEILRPEEFRRAHSEHDRRGY